MTPMKYSSSNCPSCGGHDVLSVGMTLVGSALAFAFCVFCEWKGWEHEGESLPLSSVLNLVTTR